MKYFWPGISAVLFIILIGVGAFYLGKQTKEGASITPTPTVYQSQNTDSTNSPTPTKRGQKDVTAGGILSFPTYTLQLPEGWTITKEDVKDTIDKLKLKKFGYELTIYQAAFGGGGCLYPGDAPSEMAQSYTAYTEINNSNGYTFRRSGGDVSGGQRFWTVCQKQSEGSFGTPTIFGHMSISGPLTTDASIVSEIDLILSSIKKI